MTTQDIKDKVKARYGALAKVVSDSTPGESREGGAPASTSKCCCGGSSLGQASCCAPRPADAQALSGLIRPSYRPEELDGLPAMAVTGSFGCGNPGAAARFIPGETVLDLGSGGGIDVFLAAKRVGDKGRVYGLDFTDEMLDLATANRLKAGVKNVEFLKGDLEDIPLSDCSVDFIISNCVINLAPDKDRVFAEAYRVLRPGGRLAVSDIVFQGDVSRLPRDFRDDAEAWASCVAGALEQGDYLNRLSKAGFEDLSVTETGIFPPSAEPAGGGLLPAGLRLASGLFRGRKPGDGSFGLRPAEGDDLPAVARLLDEAGLPVVGVENELEQGFIVGVSQGRVIGSAGIAMHGRAALLRSVATDSAWRGRGVGTAMVEERVEAARRRGADSVWLLTSGAARFFEQLGFRRAARASAPTWLQSSAENGKACSGAQFFEMALG